jgi:hypothetical protein
MVKVMKALKHLKNAVLIIQGIDYTYMPDNAYNAVLSLIEEALIDVRARHEAELNMDHLESILDHTVYILRDFAR